MRSESRTILLVVMGGPFESDLTTTLYRFVQAALDQGHRIVVWTCDGATNLTVRSLGDTKPRNPFKLDTEYPSTIQLTRALLARSNGQLRWFVCRQCSDERGAFDQIPEVKIQPAFRFLRYVEEADVCLVLGN